MLDCWGHAGQRLSQEHFELLALVPDRMVKQLLVHMSGLKPLGLAAECKHKSINEADVVDEASVLAMAEAWLPCRHFK